MTALLNYCNILAILVAAFTGLTQYRRMDSASRVLSLFTLLVFVTESFGRFAAIWWRDNRLVYDLYTMLELPILALYFNHTIDWFKRRQLGVVISVFSIITWLVDFLLIAPRYLLDTMYLQLQCFVVIILCLCQLLQYLLRRGIPHAQHRTHFWFAAVFLFSATISFLNWGLYDFFRLQLNINLDWMHHCLALVNICTYILMSILFIRIPKTAPVHGTNHI